jgi:hypothetical protein
VSPKFTFREAGSSFSCYNVTPLPESCCSTLFATVYEITAEGGHEVFWGFGLLLLLLLWAFWCGKLLEGKRITEGKLLKGKEWLKRG